MKTSLMKSFFLTAMTCLGATQASAHMSTGYKFHFYNESSHNIFVLIQDKKNFPNLDKLASTPLKKGISKNMTVENASDFENGLYRERRTGVWAFMKLRVIDNTTHQSGILSLYHIGKYTANTSIPHPGQCQIFYSFFDYNLIAQYVDYVCVVSSNPQLASFQPQWNPNGFIKIGIDVK